MLDTTKTMTVPMLRKYAEENNIDLGSATRRQDIIDTIEAAETTQNRATDAPEAYKDTNDPSEEKNATEGKIDVADNGMLVGDTEKVEQSTDGVIIKRLLFASRLPIKGEDVAAVHAALIKENLHVGQESVKGIYGAKTAVAVRHFQSKNRLIVDGKVGKFTAQALGFAWDDTPTE